MTEDHRKKVAEKLFQSVTNDNVEEIYKRNYSRYLFDYSDEVEINGKTFTNSYQDKMQRFWLQFPNEKSESNIHTASTSNTKDGFPITELDFIDNQLAILKDLTFEEFKQKKQYDLYSKFIEAMKSPIEPELIFDEKQPTKNLDAFIFHYDWLAESLYLNSYSPQKMFALIRENSKDLLRHRAIQELKRKINNSNFIMIADLYLIKTKFIKTKITTLLDKLIDQKILVRFDLNTFNLDVINLLDHFIDEVEVLNGTSKNTSRSKRRKKLEMQQNHRIEVEVQTETTATQNTIQPTTLKNEFNPRIFKDQNSYNLFLFLVQKYAIDRSVSQFSQIYHFLKRKENAIKKNAGIKYRSFVKNGDFGMLGKFARIEDEKRDERITLNDFFKDFDI